MFDASAVVSAALKTNSGPERALLHAEEVDVFALSGPVAAEIDEVLSRPKFARAVSCERRKRIMAILSRATPRSAIAANTAADRSSKAGRSIGAEPNVTSHTSTVTARASDRTMCRCAMIAKFGPADSANIDVRNIARRSGLGIAVAIKKRLSALPE